MYIVIDLIEIYQKEIRVNQKWYMIPKCKAAQLLIEFGDEALNVAITICDGTSEMQNYFYRQVVGILQNTICCKDDLNKESKII